MYGCFAASVLDGTSAVIRLNTKAFNSTLGFIKDIIQSVALNYNNRHVDANIGVRVALIVYGRSGARTIFYLNSHLNATYPKESMIQQVESAQVTTLLSTVSMCLRSFRGLFGRRQGPGRGTRSNHR